jgi:Uma2 family endonuclease
LEQETLASRLERSLIQLGEINSITIDRSPAMSTAVETKTHYTPEDLLAMPDGKSYELVGGQLVERNMGAESSWVGGQIHSSLNRYCRELKVGWAFPADNGYQCFPHEPKLVRRPDVSFIRFGRLAGETPPSGWIRIAPDLAVEVISPNDTVYELEGKLEDYKRVSVPLIWVISPRSRTVRVYRSGGSCDDLHEDDVLSGEDIIPGFRCLIRDVLLPRERSPEAAPIPDGPNGHG